MPSNRHAFELRIQNEERPHLSFQAATESVSFTAQRSAFSADVVVHAIGKGEVYRNLLVGLVCQIRPLFVCAAQELIVREDMAT